MDLLGLVACDHVVGDPLELYSLENCPRCKGAGYYGAVEINVLGKVATVSGGEALKQRIRKVLIEKLRPSGYGFNYALFQNVIDSATIQAIKAEVIRCLEYIVQQQKLSISEGVFFTPAEILSKVENIRVVQSPVELRQVDVSFTAIAASGKSISILETLGST